MTAPKTVEEGISAGKHTPGPWEVISFRPYEWSQPQRFIRAPNCIVKNPRGPDYAQEVLSDEDYPSKLNDLHLAATAPDMWEIVRELREYAASGKPFVYPAGMLQKLDAAWAKAEGQP